MRQWSGVIRCVSCRMMSPILDVTGVCKRYGEGAAAVDALLDIHMRVHRPSMVALVGESGSGKSTLLNIIGTVDEADAGAVHIDGQNIATFRSSQLAKYRRRSLGFVFQSFELVDSLRVFDNVALPIMLDGAINAQRTDEIHQLLDRIGLAGMERRYPDQLSGGQQQRVAVARALANRPKMILADEPTGNLDSKTGAAMLDLLGELQRDYQVTIIMATHAQQAAERCDGQVMLEDGRIIACSGAVEAQVAGHEGAPCSG